MSRTLIYEQGAIAALSGLPKSACPYRLGTLKASAWVNGHCSITNSFLSTIIGVL